VVESPKGFPGNDEKPTELAKNHLAVDGTDRENPKGKPRLQRGGKNQCHPWDEGYSLPTNLQQSPQPFM